MTHEEINAVPLVKVVEQQQEPLAFDRAGETQVTPPTAEQIHANDGVFTQQREQKQVADLLGLWASALMLHDLAVETFVVEKERDERENASEAD